MATHYFASDGSFGDANGMTIVDTSLFTDEDWETIDECYDWERPAMAERIAGLLNR
jgi:hypothetical protein